jgi:hypothetical protein
MADKTTPLGSIFGVRHLSPAAGHHIGELMKEMKPTAVLVEGPSDATDQVKHLIHKDTRPPIAILAYTKERPVRSILYPLAKYSPEWVALTWGIKNKAETRLIDLPAGIFLRMHEVKQEPVPEQGESEAKAEAETAAKPAPGKEVSEHTRAYLDDPYTEIAKISGDPDHETWWERHFEHTREVDAYRHQIHEFGMGLRELRELQANDENLIRESYMRRCIHEVLKQGHKPEKILIVCGAFHSSALIHELPPMTDKELKALPKADSSLTLMPYSYFRLSAQSGYGAGNHAPGYFERIFEETIGGEPNRLPARYLTEVAHVLRKEGQIRSAAEVIEAVRLSESLAALNGSSAPTLRDLRDAATTCLGRGDFESIKDAMIEIEVGSSIGKLPKGISRTSIQDDFYYQMEALTLEKFQTEKPQELILDLREDRFVKSKELAFRDLRRSTFFHRLAVLEIAFAAKKKTRQDDATWKEAWDLKWTPESEIQLVEGALLGDSVETACAVKLSQRLNECERIDQAASLVKDAAECQLADALDSARRYLQGMAVEATNFVQLSGACTALAEVIRYGSVRKIDPEGLKPLLAQLFLRATLGVKDACVCDDQAGREEVAPAIVKLNDVARENPELVDATRWDGELDSVAVTDTLNAYVSGYVMSLILPRVNEDTLANEVSKRLSVGAPPDVGANWLEGLVQYNREALFARMGLWRQLDIYIASLDEKGFRQALVPLRRAFGPFTAGQIRRVVSNLVEITQDSGLAQKLNTDVKLSDEEAQGLQEMLGDLEF